MNFTFWTILYLAFAAVAFIVGFIYPNYFLGVIIGIILGVIACFLSEELL